jgi:hypothetical protein
MLEDVYSFLQAPAAARKANEAFKADTMSAAPTMSQVESFRRPEERLAPGNPYPLALNPGAATSSIGARMGTQMIGPPIGGNIPSSMDLAAIAAQDGAKKGGYAPWGATSRSLFFNGMNPDPKKDDLGFAIPNDPNADPWAGMRRPGEKARPPIPGLTMGNVVRGVAPRVSVAGSSTGTQYNVGTTLKGTNGYTYALDPSGRFVNVNPTGGAELYAARTGGAGSVAEMERQHSGRPEGSYSDGREPSGTGSLW